MKVDIKKTVGKWISKRQYESGYQKDNMKVDIKKTI